MNCVQKLQNISIPIKVQIPINVVKPCPKISINEMFMRDGLQSLSKCYPLETKIKFANLLSKCNFEYLELGSTTNPKYLPQMADSDKLFETVNFNPLTKYGMLVPSYLHTQKVLNLNVHSFGLVCSVSDTFAQKNLKKTSKQSVDEVLKQIDLIMQFKPNLNIRHIRVYLSGAFGSPWEKFNSVYLKNLISIMRRIFYYTSCYDLEPHNFELVISDTFGLSDCARTELIMYAIANSFYSETNEFFAMHIHSKDSQWKKLVEICIDNKINKFDCSMGGIGGCPFAEDQAFGNISTVEIINFLQNNEMAKNYDLDKLKKTESEIKTYM